MSQPNLYWISASDNNGEDMSLFVRAHTPQDAFEMWKQHDVGFGWSCCFEEKLSPDDPEEAAVDDVRIFVVPDSNVLGAISWHTAAGVSVVAFARSI